jgi:hypothetical protein
MDIHVDAELHDGKNNIVQNTLASLFLAFNNEINTIQSRFDINEKRKILEKFEIVFNDLNHILYYGGKNDFMEECFSGHPLETLSGMASSCNLAEHFTELKELLEFSWGEITLFIHNYNRTREEKLNKYYMDKYIKNTFKYQYTQ